MPDTITPLTATGRDQRHLERLGADGRVELHKRVLQPFIDLQQAAARLDMDLQVASGFRSFDRQLAIWNAKANGSRPILDDQGRPLDTTRLSDTEKVYAILRWSALPGASRHHWGTDIDVWDRAAVPPDYQLQLTAAEYGAEGPFARLDNWLRKTLDATDAGFFRPYAIDRGGVAPEPWHLSYRPVARDFEQVITPTLLASVLQHTQIALKTVVLARLDEIFERYIRMRATA